MKTATRQKAICIIFDGPFSNPDSHGDEMPEWVVFAADDNGDEIGDVFRFSLFAPASQVARNMAADRHLELVIEAMQA